jgi:hypothetical protein
MPQRAKHKLGLETRNGALGLRIEILRDCTSEAMEHLWLVYAESGIVAVKVEV